MFYAFRAIVDGQKITLAESNPVEGIYEAVVILTTPLKKDIVSPASQPASPQSIPQAVILEKSSSATQPRLPANRAAPAGIVSAGQGAPAAGNLSPLYLDKAKRDARRSSSAGDVYLDANRDAFQRFMQGEQIQLVFEPSSNYLISPFILAENRSQLYLNFYQFNEGKPVSSDKEKLLAQIFEIQGSLPGYVKRCLPAQMVSKNEGYIINNKGVLLLESSV